MLNVDAICVHRGAQVALHDVSLSLAPAHTLAVIGESGAGKSTMVAAILGLLRLAKGRITWSGGSVHSGRPALVMQEPRAAFNPVLSLRRSVFEPMAARKEPVPAERLARLCEGLELSQDLLDRQPAQVSIGQAQRIGILRALIAKPKLVLFDEPLSALDAVTQKRTARLIADLQHEEGFAALIVTHDLGYAVAHADDIAVLQAGRIVEHATAQSFAAAPISAYGQSLRNAALSLGGLEAML